MYFVEEEVINTTNPAIPTWAGWAVTTVTSKFYSSKTSQKDEKSIELSKSWYFYLHNFLPNLLFITICTNQKN